MVRFNVRGRAYRKLHGGLFATANPFRRSDESVPWRTGDESILLLAGFLKDGAQVPTALFQLHARRIVVDVLSTLSRGGPETTRFHYWPVFLRTARKSHPLASSCMRAGS